MDLAELDFEAVSEAGHKASLYHPLDKGKDKSERRVLEHDGEPFWIKVRLISGSRMSRFMHEQARAAQGDDDAIPAYDEVHGKGVRFALEGLIDWRIYLNGEWVDVSKAPEVLANEGFGWVADQIVAAMRETEGFFPGEASASDTTQKRSATTTRSRKKATASGRTTAGRKK